jgi:thiol-disulfide isomerase/thioredoxin
MKNPVMLFGVIALVAIVGIGAYTLSQGSSQSDSMMQKDEALMPKEETAMQPTDAMMKKDDTAMVGKPSAPSEDGQMMEKKMAGSGYVQYSKSALDSAATNRRVLFFYATWCPTCQAADASLTQDLSKIPQDVTVIRVNYNDPETDQEEKALASTYGITYQHTFVQIDSTGKEITKWNGGDIDELLKNVK